MANEFLPPARYQGSLTPNQVATGINAALRNARRLVTDAKILFDANRYPTAAALAALAIEEVGKMGVLRRLSLAQSPAELKQAWRQYSDHRSKNVAWILPDLISQGAQRLNQWRQAVDVDGEHTALLNLVKQSGLYTDCYGNVQWWEPERVIPRHIAELLVTRAELFSQRPDVTSREIELWVKHMRPAWNTPEVINALMRLSSDMYAEGLSPVTPEEMGRLVGGEEFATIWKMNLRTKH